MALPVLLQQNGYSTFFAGKYLNEYDGDEVPPGWSDWFGLVGNSKYYNYLLNENGIVHSYTDKYLTDLIVSFSWKDGRTFRVNLEFYFTERKSFKFP